MNITQRYKNIRSTINKAKKISNTDIEIVAVSKTRPIENIQEAIDNKIKIFGENKVQEALEKYNNLTGNFSLHFIGHLQSNKARDAVKIFDLIHTIDKFSTANKLNTEAQKINKIQNILIQVNTTAESTKSGIYPNEVNALVENIIPLKNIKLMGLMTMGPSTGEKAETRRAFAQCKGIFDDINNRYNINLTVLSMGMSSDYEIAIEEGSSMVRIGTAIFGERKYI